MVRMIGTLLVLAGALGTGSCGLLDPDEWEARREALARNAAVWEAAAPDAYRYQLSRACFCASAGDFVVTVEDGVVVSARRTQGDTVPHSDLQYLETVDDLFATVQRAIEDEAYRFRVEYHPELGYPTLIDLDPDRNIIDEEIWLVAGNLTAVQPGN